jgi:hypothetical protein
MHLDLDLTSAEKNGLLPYPQWQGLGVGVGIVIIVIVAHFL